LLNLQIAPNKADRSLSISGRANAEPPPLPLAIKGGAGGGGGGGGGDGTVEPDMEGGVAVPNDVAALLFTLSGLSPLTFSSFSDLLFCLNCSLAS
jgi:hypothetical protein